MGITDRIKDLTKKAEDAAAEHKGQIQSAVAKAQAAADERTGGQYRDQIQKVGGKVQTYLDGLPEPTAGADGEPEAPASDGKAAPPPVR